MGAVQLPGCDCGWTVPRSVRQRGRTESSATDGCGPSVRGRRSRRAGHPAAGQADRRGAPGQRLGQGVAARALRRRGTRPAGRRRRRRCCAARSTGDSPADDAVAVDQHGAVGAEAGQHRAGAPGPQLGRRPRRRRPMRVQRRADDLGQLVPVGLDQRRARPSAAARSAGPLVSTATATPAATSRSHSCANASTGSPGGRLPQATTQSAPPAAASTAVGERVELGRRQRRPGLVDLRDRAVGLGEGDVGPGAPGDRHRDAGRRPRPAAGGPAGCPPSPPHGSTARDGTPLASSARDTLTPLPPGSSRAGVARMTSPRASPSTSMVRSRLGLRVTVTIMRAPPARPAASMSVDELVVEPGVGDEQVDVGRASRTGPGSRCRSWCGRRAAPRAGRRAIIARLTAASAGSGVVSPRSTEQPLVPMNATST